MNPLDPASLKMVAQTEGQLECRGWSPDDSELLAMSAVTNERKVPVAREGGDGREDAAHRRRQGRWGMRSTRPDGKSVYGRQQPRGRHGCVSGAPMLPTSSGRRSRRKMKAVESFALSPDGRTLAVMFDSTTAEPPANCSRRQPRRAARGTKAPGGPVARRSAVASRRRRGRVHAVVVAHLG